MSHGKVPGNVYLFCKDLDIKEDVFYKYYGTFEAIDSEIFQSFFDNTVKVLDKSEDFKSFDSRNRLLSFYYTYFEVLKANRSFVTQVLTHKKDVMKSLTVLSGVKKRFQEYLDEIGVEELSSTVSSVQRDRGSCAERAREIRPGQVNRAEGFFLVRCPSRFRAVGPFQALISRWRFRFHDAARGSELAAG